VRDRRRAGRGRAQHLALVSDDKAQFRGRVAQAGDHRVGGGQEGALDVRGGDRADDDGLFEANRGRPRDGGAADEDQQNRGAHAASALRFGSMPRS
jgi:hypothetical protein